MPQLTIEQAFQIAFQHHQAGRFSQAENLYRQILAQQPQHAHALHYLGVIATQVGQNDHAVNLIRQAIAISPNCAEAHNNLGIVLRAQGQLDEAITAFRRAATLKANFSEALNNLGNVLKDQGELDQAIVAFRQAIAHQPDFTEAHYNLGNTLHDKGELDEAIIALRQAIAHQNSLPEAHNNLGNALKDVGQLDAAIAAYHQALALRPGYAEAHSNLALGLHCHPSYDAQAIAEEHRRWNRLHAEPLKQQIQPHANDRTPDRRLRIGYVSPDLREHPVGQFLLPLLANHDKSRVEVFAYAHVPAPDELTQRLRAHTDGWRSIVGLSDAQAAELIRQDRIDILVDLAGHTASGRLLLFARKPAPVQVTYLGYPNTTGLSTMDYRLTDAYADPPGQTEQYHSEQLVRLSPCAWCYQPSQCPPVTARREGPITFGCFNTLAKVTEPMLRLWGRILHAAPESRMLLKSAGLNSVSARQRVRELLDQEGIEPSRLELRGYEPNHDRHLALYGAMDIALDTFPYHCTTTTCEALWMGVPVVTLAGPTHVSRVGTSLLSNAGLPELVAQDPDDYISIASHLAADKVRLAKLRGNLRQMLQQSPLTDAPRFASDVEAAYRQMWRNWCNNMSALR